MHFRLPPAHRLARANYPVRTGSFAFCFLVVVALMFERGFTAWVVILAALTFLVYPQLAYLHARAALDSRRAELKNLAADSWFLGFWIAQLHFALLPGLGALVAINLNNAVSGGTRRLAWGLLWFSAAAFLWGAVQQFAFEPVTGPAVTGLCLVGIAGYISAFGVVVYRQNRNLVDSREALSKSEAQFRFIVEGAGDLILVLVPGGRIHYRSVSHLNHFDPNAVEPGADWVDLVHPDDRARAREFLGSLEIPGTSGRIKLRLLSSKSVGHTVEFNGTSVQDVLGGSTHLMVLASHAMGSMQGGPTFSPDAYLFNRFVDGVLITDVSGRVLFIDRSYAGLTGHALHEVIGRTNEELRSGIGSERPFDQMGLSLERAGNWHGRYLERCRDGTLKLVWAHVYALQREQGVAIRYVWIIVRDSSAAEGFDLPVV